MVETMLELIESEGETLAVEGRSPVVLASTASVWMVKSRQVDVFQARIADDLPSGARHHLFSVGAGE
ncbi:MAG: hypothetical protein HY815_16850, partial [Candidatus Riflebacteria bacterium]|nr:hypothetical protein [Candidatus Riflebacteria bacterium]